MHKTKKKTILPLGRMIAQCLIALLIASCSRDKEEVVPDKKSDSVIKVTISGINEPTIISSVKSLASKANLTKSEGGAIRREEKFVHPSGMDVLTTMESPVQTGNSTDKFADSQANGSSEVSLKATSGAEKFAAVPMITENQFRILIYDATGTTLLQNVAASSGTNPELEVEAGATYRWFSFSINERTVPNINNGKVAAADLANKDVLFASGTIDTKLGENFLNIIFDHKTTRFDVDVDTRGIFGSINTLRSLQLGTEASDGQYTTLLYTADLDIFSGNFGTPTEMATANTAANVVNKDISTADMVKTVSLYTVIPAGRTIDDQALRISPVFSINLDHAVLYPPNTTPVTTREFGSTTDRLRIANLRFSPQAGSTYSLSMRAIESGILANGTIWARSDLWYDGTAARTFDKYRFRSDPAHAPYPGKSDNEQTEYWHWMSLTPASPIKTGDPCLEVYPKGIWRMPTRSEAENLTQQRTPYPYSGFSNPNSNADTYDWIALVNLSFDGDGGSSRGNFSEYSNRILFAFNGIMDADGKLISSRSQVDSRSNTARDGIYTHTSRWTSDEWESVPDANCTNCGTTFAHTAYQTDYRGPYDFTVNYEGRSTRFDIGFAQESQFRQIRCVRNQSWGEL